MFILLLVLTAPVHAQKVESCDNTAQCITVQVHSKNTQARADIIVYLQPIDGQKIVASSNTITVAQKNKAFAPYLSVSQTKQAIHFENKDDITHHIYSVNKANPFAFKIKAGMMHSSAAFANTAEIAMGCNIHDWMSGYVLLVDTPYFGATNSRGQISFSLTELGRYRVVVWHPQLAIDEHRFSEIHRLEEGGVYSLTLPKNIEVIPKQVGNEDFDFVSDY